MCNHVKLGRSSAPGISLELVGNLEPTTWATYEFDTGTDTVILTINCPDELLIHIKLTCDKDNNYDFDRHDTGHFEFRHSGHSACSQIEIVLSFGLACFEHHVRSEVLPREAKDEGCTVDPNPSESRIYRFCDDPGFDQYLDTFTALPSDGWVFKYWHVSGYNIGWYYMSDYENPTASLYMKRDAWHYNDYVSVQAVFVREGMLYFDDGLYDTGSDVTSRFLKSSPGIADITSVDAVKSMVNGVTEAVASVDVYPPYEFSHWMEKSTGVRGLYIEAWSEDDGRFLPWHSYTSRFMYKRSQRVRVSYDGDPPFPSNVCGLLAVVAPMWALDVVVDFLGVGIGKVDPKCVLELDYSHEYEDRNGYARFHSGDLLGRSYWWAGRYESGRLYNIGSGGLEKRKSFFGRSIAPAGVELYSIEIQNRTGNSSYATVNTFPVSGPTFSFAGNIIHNGNLMVDYTDLLARARGGDDPYAYGYFDHCCRIVFKFRTCTANTGMLLYGGNGFLLYGSKDSLLYSGDVVDPCSGEIIK